VLVEQADTRERTLRDTEAELVSLRQQLEDERRQIDQQRQMLDTLTETLRTAEAYRTELLAAHAAEQARWQEERRLLEERARHAEDLAADLAREARLARDSERRAQQHEDEQRAALEREVREYQQQLAELQTVHAALTASTTQRLEEFERERRTWSTREADSATRIQTTESWCADQQELLYQIRRQMTAMFTLLEGRGHLLAGRAGSQLSLADAAGTHGGGLEGVSPGDSPDGAPPGGDRTIDGELVPQRERSEAAL
jgi:chromosome segregation ATPase